MDGIKLEMFWRHLLLTCLLPGIIHSNMSSSGHVRRQITVHRYRDSASSCVILNDKERSNT